MVRHFFIYHRFWPPDHENIGQNSISAWFQLQISWNAEFARAMHPPKNVNGSTLRAKESVNGSRLGTRESVNGSRLGARERVNGSRLRTKESVNGSRLGTRERVNGSRLRARERVNGSTLQLHQKEISGGRFLILIFYFQVSDSALVKYIVMIAVSVKIRW